MKTQCEELRQPRTFDCLYFNQLDLSIIITFEITMYSNNNYCLAYITFKITMAKFKANYKESKAELQM